MSAKGYDVGGVLLPRPFRLQRLGHIGLTHSQLEAGTNFYVDGLGFRKTDGAYMPGNDQALGWFSSHASDHHTLVHIDAAFAKDDPLYAAGITVNQISFQVGTLREVVEAKLYFEQQGIKTWRYGRDYPGSNWAIYGYDPDGFLIELFYGMEQIGWDRRSKPTTFHRDPWYAPVLPEPAEISEITASEAADGITCGFRHEEKLPFDHDVGGVQLPRPFAINDVGPVHLFVDDVDRSAAFYTEHLGLELSEEASWRGHRALFLRVGSKHHVIGLFPIALREALGFDTRTKLMSFGIELGSYRQLKDAVAWLEEQGLPRVAAPPPELRPGIDYAAFFRDPSGHVAMLYCGIEQIGWDGRPRPAAQRRVVAEEWPEALEPMPGTLASLTRQGPMA